MPSKKHVEAKNNELSVKEGQALRSAVFEGAHIRRTFQNDEWWFSVIDVVNVLTGASNPRRYWSDLKRKLKIEGYDQLYEKIVQLKLTSSDGKQYATWQMKGTGHCWHFFRRLKPQRLVSRLRP